MIYDYLIKLIGEVFFMNEKPDIVQVRVDKPAMTSFSGPSKALQIKIDNNKSIIVYNRVNNYILDALMKAVFPHDN